MSFQDAIKEIRKDRPQVYKTFTLDLSDARSDYELPIVGNYFNVIDATDLNVNIQVRFNEQSSDAITLKKRQAVKIPFYRLFITNEAQAGKSITIAYGISETPFELMDNAAIFEVQSIANQQSSGPTLYNVACTLAATEYSQALPDDTKKFSVKARGGVLKVCFTATASGTTYINLEDGQSLSEDLLFLTGKTLYFQSSTAGTVAEIIAWG